MVVLSTHLLMDTWAVSILAIVSNAAMNTGVLTFFQSVFWFPLDILPEVGLLGQKADPAYSCTT